jgi:hypothetical protein
METYDLENNDDLHKFCEEMLEELESEIAEGHAWPRPCLKALKDADFIEWLNRGGMQKVKSHMMTPQEPSFPCPPGTPGDVKGYIVLLEYIAQSYHVYLLETGSAADDDVSTPQNQWGPLIAAPLRPQG